MGAAGDAATSVNSGVNNGGLAAPLALPVQSLGLGGSLAPNAVAPTLNAAVNPSLAAPLVNPAAFAQAAPVAQPAALGYTRLAPAAVAGKPVQTPVPGALAPASKTAAPGGNAAASKQVEALSLTAKPILEGVKSGDATQALSGVYENGSQRGELGAVAAKSGPAALRSGLKKSAPSTEQQPSAEVPPPRPRLQARPLAADQVHARSLRVQQERSPHRGPGGIPARDPVYLASCRSWSARHRDASMTGVARMVHYWVAAGSLFAERSSPRPRRFFSSAAVGAPCCSARRSGPFGGCPGPPSSCLVGEPPHRARNHLVDIDTAARPRSSRARTRKATDQDRAGYVTTSSTTE